MLHQAIECIDDYNNCLRASHEFRDADGQIKIEPQSIEEIIKATDAWLANAKTALHAQNQVLGARINFPWKELPI
jgi:hypothetical protein